MQEGERKPLRSFGRVKGRALKPRQAGLIETLLPHLAIEIPETGEIDLASASPADELIPPTDETPPLPSRVILEIGFGGGEHLVAQAVREPNALFLGAEPFVNGVGSCLRHIEESGVTNVRLHHGDARDVLGALPAASLDLVYILFPDPWPKARHWKRRLIQAEFVAALAHVVKPSGEVRFATDWKAYAAWTLAVFPGGADFVWRADCVRDWQEPWPDHEPSRYERKALGDTKPVYLKFERREGLTEPRPGAI